MFIRTADMSYLILPAREVHRLAIQSIADIDSTRHKLIDEAIKKAENETCSYLLGLYRHKRYSSRTVALVCAPEVQMAKQYAEWDRMTCILLKKAAQYLMDNGKLSEEQRVIHVSLNDFRALT